MKKLLLVILLSFGLTGCLYQTADTIDIERAIYFCGKPENIAYITLFAAGKENIECKDGRSISGHSVKIK